MVKNILNLERYFLSSAEDRSVVVGRERETQKSPAASTMGANKELLSNS